MQSTAVQSVLTTQATAAGIGLAYYGESYSYGPGPNTTAALHMVLQLALVAAAEDEAVTGVSHEFSCSRGIQASFTAKTAAAPLSGAPAVQPAASQAAAAAAAAAAAGAAVTDISVLELTLAVAQVPEGALQLWQQGLVPVLAAYCRQLMHTEHSTGLLDVASLGFVGPSSDSYGPGLGLSGFELSAQLEVSLSTLGAYMSLVDSAAGSSVQTVKGLPAVPGGIGARGGAGGGSGGVTGCMWSPRHQQWCLLLGLLSTLLQQLSKATAVEDIAMQLLVAVEPRLLLAVQLQNSSGSGSIHESHSHSGASGHSGQLPGHHHSGAFALAWGPQSGFGSGRLGHAGHTEAPLLITLANLLEAEKSLFLLKFMVPHLGVWQLQRPGSLAAFRTAAARLVEFVAAPSLNR